MVSFYVFDIPIGSVTMDRALQQVSGWIREPSRPARLVTFTNVHMAVEAQRSSALNDILQQTDLNCPDGSPIAWIGKKKLGAEVSQVPGPEFMPLFCEQSVAEGYSHYLYGGAPGVAARAATQLELLYPGIKIAGHYSPPFRRLTAEEDAEVCQNINASGADVVWVALGCPKQEAWIFEHRKLLNASVLLAVGQALDILGGATDRAPEFMRRHGLEWAYRLCQDPRRLWKRYFVSNSLFLLWMTRNAVLKMATGKRRSGPRDVPAHFFEEKRLRPSL